MTFYIFLSICSLWKNARKKESYFIWVNHVTPENLNMDHIKCCMLHVVQIIQL